MTPDQIIAEVKASYSLLYPNAKSREMIYNNGWYTVSYGDDYPPASFRERDVLAAINRYQTLYKWSIS